MHTSPAAYKPSQVVFWLRSVTTYPWASHSARPFTSPVSGSYPANTNTPKESPSVLLYSVTSPVSVFRYRRRLRPSFPDTSSTCAWVITVIFSWWIAASATAGTHENPSPRMRMVTCLAYLVKNTLSSAAAKPPPTTKTSFPVKNSPSQVAQ